MDREPDQRQEELFGLGAEFGRGTPLVYIAAPLSHLKDARDREHVELLAHAIEAAIREQTRGEPDSWPLRVHSPVKLSAPWKGDSCSPLEIYERNTTLLWTEADALIVIADRGGSLGIGQELEWAFDLQLPVLYLYRDGDPVSRQVEGAASEYDLAIEAFSNPEGMRDLVCRWLVSRKHVICDGPRRRAGREIRIDPLRASFERAWRPLSAEERREVALSTRISETRIKRLVGDPLVLAAAGVEELSLLAGALAVPAVPDLLVRPLPDLLPRQRAALGNAAAEFDWDYETTLNLDRRARLEISRGGTRRLPLSSPQDWANFRRGHGED
jgi:hypothetical protein